MAVKTFSLPLTSRGNAEIHDITAEVASHIVQRGLKDGTVTVFSQSSTSGVTTIEYESGAVSDLKRLFDEIVPSNREYAHNARWGDGNGHSHVRASLLGPSLTVPFVNSRLILGTWQQIIFVDFDNKPRKRELILQVIGE
jgi:secondary thiamine-phosphate synthase enzyme